MGKNKDKKKKGLGMEKTLAKTEKKIQKNIKKELDEIGEDDVEKLIAEFNEKERAINTVKEEALPAGKFPSRRGGSTFNLLPERDELVLFGGEYFNGHKVAMFNDLYVYSIKKSIWSLIKAPKGPPPRTFHQSAVVSRNGGELWVFGGEFSSPSQSQFYHYNDLWVFNFQTKQWTKINSPNGPSARSGHRMVVLKKHLVVFGGYYDNLRNCKFYNDVHLFNLETNQWEEVKFSTTGLSEQPSPRSACQLSVCAKTNSIVMYGGFSKEKLKKEKEKGITYSDMFVLQQEIKKEKVEWSWKRVKQTGLKPTERISFSMITINDDTSLLFGGVYDLKDDDDEDDEEDEDKANSMFYNDLYKLDLTTFKWTLLRLKGKREIKTKKGKSSEMEASNESSDKIDLNESEMNDESMSESVDQLKLETSDAQDESSPFQLTYAKEEQIDKMDTIVMQSDEPRNQLDVFLPHPRRSSYLQFHKGNLYLYGGKFEDVDDKEITLNDLYCLNMKKLDEWNLLYEDPEFKLELKKAAESDDEDDNDEESEGSESELEIDAPRPNFPTETIEEYYSRTNELWLTEASSEFPDEKSKKFLKKVAFELCQMFWDNFKNNNNESGLKSAEPEAIACD